MGNMFCGYACVVYATRGEFETAAPFIGVAIVLDMLDGRIARMTGTASEFGVQFDSLADIITFGIAPAILAFEWGLVPLGRLGLGRRVHVPRRRGDAAGALQHPERRGRRQALLRRLAESGRGRHSGGDGVYAYPAGLSRLPERAPGARVVLVPAVLMVSKIRFRSFKTFDLQTRRPYTVLLFIAAGIVLVTTHPRYVLVGDGLHLPRVRVHRHGHYALPTPGRPACRPRANQSRPVNASTTATRPLGSTALTSASDFAE